MRISQVYKRLKLFLAVPQVVPAIMRGGPGIGKSEIVLQLAVEMAEKEIKEARDLNAKVTGLTKKVTWLDSCEACQEGNPDPEAHIEGCPCWHEKKWCNAICQQAHRVEEAQRPHICVIDKRLAQEDPISIGGLPAVDEGGETTRYYHQAWLPIHPSLRCILFLDEFGCAPQAVQNAALQLVNERSIGGAVLSPRCSIIAATNREQDGAALSKLTGPMKNRLAWFDVETNSDDWVAWGHDHDVRPEILGVVEHLPDKFLPEKFDKDADAQPTPRSLTRLSRLWIQAGISDDADIRGISLPLIGKGATSELMAFLTAFRSVSPKDIVENGRIPEFAKKDVSEQFAAACAVANYCRNKDSMTGDNTKHLFGFLDRIGIELRVKCLRDMKLGNRPAFMKQFLKQGGTSFRELMTRLADVVVED
jgi:hypothetical protein